MKDVDNPVSMHHYASASGDSEVQGGGGGGVHDHEALDRAAHDLVNSKRAVLEGQFLEALCGEGGRGRSRVEAQRAVDAVFDRMHAKVLAGGPVQEVDCFIYVHLERKGPMKAQ